MIALIQRVARAEVAVAGAVVASIDAGLLALVCAERDDDDAIARRLMAKLVGYRVFADAQGRMNRSLLETGGDLLLVPQFTLAADTRSGARPSFTRAAPPAEGRLLFDRCVAHAAGQVAKVATGVFGADMQVTSTNDGPVTFWLQVPGREIA